MQGECLECGGRLVGRVDKKFCSDHCRNAFHNEKNKVRRNLLRRVNNALRKNYRILESFQLTGGSATTTRKRLLESGFDFDLHTSVYTTAKGKTYHFIYDLGYLSLEEGYYLIVRKHKRLEKIRISS